MKTLPYDKAKMEQIIKKYPTPFHIYDEAGIISAAHNLQRAFQWNVGYKEYYAVKACPNPAILKLLHRNGCGMDCSSETELMLCEKLGITGEDIMFSSNDTPAREFEYARKLGAIVNLDDYTHIDFLAQHGGIPETVCLRYNSGGDFKLGNTIMGNPGDAKYGMTRRQIFDGVKKLMGLGAKKFGLHAFLASNTTDNSYYPTLAGLLFELAAELHKELGATIDFVNLSGGVGIPYRPEQEPADIIAIGQGVKEAYERVIVPAGLHPLKIKTELGRYMTGALRPAGDNGAAPQGHLQALHRRGRLRGEPDAPGDVRRVSPHHGAGQGKRPLRPHLRRDGFAVREQRQIRRGPRAARNRRRRYSRHPRYRRARLCDGL